MLVIEDIYDTGTTMKQLLNKLNELGASSLRVAIAFHKRNPANLKHNYKADYLGFVVPNDFIVGYGVDYNEKFRETKHLFKINSSGIAKFAY